jgi:outer membrane protein insertion porin family
VEENIEINAENYRIAPGAGLRISVPALGPAPLALDFAFPVAQAETDDTQVFSFFFGFGR